MVECRVLLAIVKDDHLPRAMIAHLPINDEPTGLHFLVRDVQSEVTAQNVVAEIRPASVRAEDCAGPHAGKESSSDVGQRL